MQVLINGKSNDFDEENIHIEKLLAKLDVESPDIVSVQLNGEIIEREKYKEQLTWIQSN